MEGKIIIRFYVEDPDDRKRNWWINGKTSFYVGFMLLVYTSIKTLLAQLENC